MTDWYLRVALYGLDGGIVTRIDWETTSEEYVFRKVRLEWERQDEWEYLLALPAALAYREHYDEWP